jgi:putative heme-binding domain-containing protein
MRAIHSLLLFFSSCLFVFYVVDSSYPQQDAKVPDPDPELERKSFQVADGFEVNLFAADPLLAKPLQMAFDAAGRLWVASSEVYPQIKPGQKANDKVIVLEDSKGVGKADKITVFADGLLIPTGIEPGDGGVYVANSTELVHLSASKAGAKADTRRIVLSGFGTEDTHHMLHALRWGPDGMLYMNQSIYIHSHIETPHGVRRLNAGGVWRFRPETMELDVFLHGFCNPWGHHFDRWGQSFVTDGAYGEGINYGLPGARYVFTPNETRIMWGLNPGSPKHCGLEILSGRHLPDDWQGNMITNDFRGHRVCRFVVTPDGAGYTSREKPELIKTNHGAFRPIDVKMGPDGAIYIADWYNPIIQHGEVDFRDTRRDHVHGRIWRVTAKGRPLVPRPKLVGAPTEDLLEALKAPEDWTRHFAKRVMKERGEEVLPALAAWVQKLDAKDADHEHRLLEALWTYQSLNTVEPKLLDTLLYAKDARIRAAAVRVASQWRARLDDPVNLLAARVADDHPQVRLEAVRALADFPGARAAELAMQALDRPIDKFLDYALWLTARELAPHWLPHFQAGKLDFSRKAQQLVFALQAANSPAAVRPLLDLVKAGRISAEREEAALSLIAMLGDPKELATVFDLALDESMPGRRRVNLLACLEHSARQRHAKPEGDLHRISKMLKSSDAVRSRRNELDPLSISAIHLAGLWRVQTLRNDLEELAGPKNSNSLLRQAALESLTQLSADAARKFIEPLARGSFPDDIRHSSIIALAAIDASSAAKHAAEYLCDIRVTPNSGFDEYEAENVTDIFRAFMQRKNGIVALTKAIRDREDIAPAANPKKLSADVAKVGIRAVRGTSKDAEALVEALKKAGGLETVSHTLSADEMKQMIADVAKHGDPARGEALYRRKDQVCQKCHAIAGAGGQVGPDLTSIGASAQVDYLIESILLPNKAIKENYHSLNVALKDGRLVAGIPVRQTEKELVLRDAEDREVTISVKDIELKEQGGSLMPEGLADMLTRAELVDLVRFLSELGKVGPYSVGNSRLVRRWQVLEMGGGLGDSRTASEKILSGGSSAATADDPSFVWTSVYSTVAGVLPLEGLSRLTAHGNWPDTIFLRFQLDASTPGKIKLLCNPKLGMVWLDRKPLEVEEAMVIDVKSGLNTITLAVAPHGKKDALRVELEDLPGSPARVRIVSGK